MKEPRVIDAEFTVVSGPTREERQPWNGIGVPPEWRTWGLFQRLIYVVVFAAIMYGVWLGAHGLTDLIGLH